MDRSERKSISPVISCYKKKLLQILLMFKMYEIANVVIVVKNYRISHKSYKTTQNPPFRSFGTYIYILMFIETKKKSTRISYVLKSSV